MTKRSAGRAPSLGFLVWHLSLRWRVGLDRALAPLGLTSAQYSLLAWLSALSSSGKAPSQSELADYSGLERMYVSKLVRALEAASLLKRTDSRSDPRAFELALTRRGREAVAAGVATVRRLEEQRLSPLGGPRSTRSAELMETLQTLLSHADNVDRRLPG